MFTLRNLAIICVLSSGLNAYPLLASGNRTHRIIGENDLLRVPASEAQDPKVQAIGRIALGCTATHLGNGIAITAGHCFTNYNFKGVREHVPCADAEHEVTWGLTYDSQGYLTSKCQEVIAMELNEQRDYALFRVHPIPSSHIEIAEEAVPVDSDISIYSHPRKRPLEWSQWCKMEGYIEKSQNQQIYYACDTEGGSSGASVLNADFQVVAIHNFYYRLLDRNGATLISSTPAKRILQESVSSVESEAFDDI